MISQEIFNLTGKKATVEQVEAGVVDPSEDINQEIYDLLQVTEASTPREIFNKANALSVIAARARFPMVMVEGPAVMMASLERVLRARGLRPLHPFYKEMVKEVAGEDGRVQQISVLVHTAFLEAVA